MLISYVDGAIEPKNPGGVPAYGYVVFHDGVLIQEGYGLVESPVKLTNNVAEFEAVIAALSYLVEMGLISETVQIMSDSQLIINLSRGTKSTKMPHLRQLRQRVRELERNFVEVQYQWIPREQNEYADMLSRLAYKLYA